MWATSDIIFNLLKASVFGRNRMIRCIPYPILYCWQLTWIQVLLGINTNASVFSIYSIYYCYVNPFLNKANARPSEMSERWQFNAKWAILNYIMTRSSFILMRWCPLCTRQTAYLLSLQCLKFKNNDWLALNQVNVSRVERHVYL